MVIGAFTDMRNLNDLLTEAPDVQDAPGAGPLVLATPMKGAAIEFDSVTFMYPAGSQAPNRVEAQVRPVPRRHRRL